MLGGERDDETPVWLLDDEIVALGPTAGEDNVSGRVPFAGRRDAFYEKSTCRGAVPGAVRGQCGRVPSPTRRAHRVHGQGGDRRVKKTVTITTPAITVCGGGIAPRDGILFFYRGKQHGMPRSGVIGIH